MSVNCSNLFETLLSKIDTPYEYNQILAKYLCDLSNAALSGVVIVDGLPVFIDPVRGKGLSYTRPQIRAAAYGCAVTQQYLLMDDVPTMGEQGYILPRDATITGMWGKSRSAGPWTLEVRKNGADITVASVAVTNGSYDSNMNIDMNEGDILQLYCNGASVEYPIGVVEIAWRVTI